MPIEIASPLELYAVDLINAERAQAGLKPVHTEVHLNSAAQSHADWMAEEKAISHTGENGSTPTDRIEASEFPLQGASWHLAENVAYKGVNGSVTEADMDDVHAALMNSETHKANILDPEVSYIGVGLSVGQVAANGGVQDAVFVTQNFAYTSEPVLVQEEMGGQGMLTTYLDGEPVPGTSQPISEDEDEPGSEDDTDGDGIPDHQDDDPQQPSTAGGSCFVATAAYGDRLHPDVVTLRRFRDQVLVRYPAGRAFIRFYWIVGPQLAKFVQSDRFSGRIARLALRPCVKGAGRFIGPVRTVDYLEPCPVLGRGWRSSAAAPSR